MCSFFSKMNFWVDPLASSASISGRCLSSLLLPGPFGRLTGRPEARPARKADQEISEGCNRLIRNRIICWKYLYLTHKSHTGKNRGRAQKVVGHRRNPLTAVVGQFQHAWRVRFLGREASGYDRRSSPQKADRSHPRKLRGAKSMIYTPFQ